MLLKKWKMNGRNVMKQYVNHSGHGVAGLPWYIIILLYIMVYWKWIVIPIITIATIWCIKYIIQK